MRRILQILRIEIGEERVVFFALLYSFLLGIPQLFSAAAASALFLVDHSARDLPAVYIIGGAVIAFLGLGVMALQRRYSSRAVLRAIHLFLFVGLAFFIVIFRFEGDAKWPKVWLLIWIEVEYTLTEMVFWLYANHVFHIRQAKRLFGIVGIGQVFAAVIGGVVAPLLVARTGTEFLLVISLGGILAALASFEYINRIGLGGRSHEEAPNRPKREAEGRSASRGTTKSALAGFQFLRNRYVRAIFLVVLIEVFVRYFLEALFYNGLDTRFARTESIASFLAVFIGAAGVVKIVFKGLVASRWIDRYGVSGAILSPALVVGVPAAALAVILILTQGQHQIVFAVTAAARFAETVFVSSVYAPAFFTLFQPLPGNVRARIQNSTDTIVAQIAAVAAGLLLLILLHRLAITFGGLSAALTLLLAVWAAVALRIGGLYRRELSHSLAKRGLVGDELVTDASHLDFLSESIGSPYAGEVIYSIEKIHETDPNALLPFMERLSNHPDPAVRERVSAMRERASLRGAILDVGHEVQLLAAVDKRSGAIAALSESEDDSTGALESLYYAVTTDFETKTAVIRLLRDMRSLKVTETLIKLCGDSDLRLLREALFSLHRRQFACPPDFRRFFDSIIQTELDLGSTLIRLFRSTESFGVRGAEIELLRRALRHEYYKVNERMFLVLGFNYPRSEIITIRHNILSDYEEQRFVAIELAEALLDKQHRKSIVPYLDGAARSAIVVGEIGAARGLPGKSYESVLEAIFSLAIPRGLGWMANTAAIARERVDGTRSHAWNQRLLSEHLITERTIVDRVLLLRRAEIFSGIAEEDLAELATHVSQESFDDGTEIIQKGDTGAELYVITDGRVKAHDGDTTYVESGEGGIFGELSALSPEVRSASVTAVSETSVLRMTGSDLQTFMESNVQAAREILAVLCRQIRNQISMKFPTPEIDARSYRTRSYAPLGTTTPLETVMILKSCEVLRGTPEAILATAARSLEVFDIEKGDTLYREGERDVSLYMILSGKIKLTVVDKGVGAASDRETIGEIAAADGGVRAFTATAESDASIIEITGATVQELLWDQFPFAFSLIQRSIDWLRTLTRMD